MPTPKKGKKSKIHKGDLLKLDIGDLAEQLTLYEHTLYAKITKQECLAYAKVQTGKAVARLLEFCKTHDRLNQWVKTSVLNSDVLAKRADLIDHWIKVAEVRMQLPSSESNAKSAVEMSFSQQLLFDERDRYRSLKHLHRKAAYDMGRRGSQDLPGNTYKAQRPIGSLRRVPHTAAKRRRPMRPLYQHVPPGHGPF